MGFRIRKSFKIAPGIKLNLSKKGLGMSAGVKGLRVNSNGRTSIGTGPVTYQGNWKSSESKGQKSKVSFLTKLILFVIIFFVLFHFIR